MRPRVIGRSIAALLVAIGLLIGSANTGTAEPVRHTGAAATKAWPKVWLEFQYPTWSHWTPDPYESSHAGDLWAGWSYVYCKKWGVYLDDKGRGSAWWLLTDDDSGNRNVFVTPIYLTQASWDRFVTGAVPEC